MKEKIPFMKRAGTRSVMASIIAILIGIVVGCLVVLIASLTNKVKSDDIHETFYYYKAAAVEGEQAAETKQVPLTRNETESGAVYYTSQTGSKVSAYYVLSEADLQKLTTEGVIPEGTDPAACRVIAESEIVTDSEFALRMKAAFDGIRLVGAGIFATGRDTSGNLTFGFNGASIGNMLFRAIPLIMTGLAVAFAYKTGLFNIGAPGQYLAGTTVSLFIALSVPTDVVPAWLVWILAFIGGALAGAIWGAIPGLLKALLNINEVIACIMTNWLMANITTWVFQGSNLRNYVESTKSGYIYKTAFLLEDFLQADGSIVTYAAGDPAAVGTLVHSRGGIETAKMGLDSIFPGSQINGGIIIAILIAVCIYILMNKTTFGFELRACGSNRFAARYAGIKDRRNIVVTMMISGALAGLGAALYWLSGNTEFYYASAYQSLPAVGFNGIPVALLASSNPVGTIFSGTFMSMLNVNGLQVKNLTALNEYITNVIIAVIVYVSAFSLLIKTWLSKGRKIRKPVPGQESLKADRTAEKAAASAAGKEA